MCAIFIFHFIENGTHFVHRPPVAAQVVLIHQRWNTIVPTECECECKQHNRMPPSYTSCTVYTLLHILCFFFSNSIYLFVLSFHFSFSVLIFSVVLISIFPSTTRASIIIISMAINNEKKTRATITQQGYHVQMKSLSIEN